MPNDAQSAKTREHDARDVPVLVVDDQAAYREVLRAVIDRASGFVLVGEACCGEEAATAVAAHSPELVLMDVVMPGMGGIAAARSILARAQAPVVVLISADDQALSTGAAVLGDNVACVQKQDLLPARLRELWDGVAGSAAGRSPRSPASA